MRENNDEFKKWLIKFVALYKSDESSNDLIVYKRRFNPDSIKEQMKAIYSNYEYITRKELDIYSKLLIIGDIINVREQELEASYEQTRKNGGVMRSAIELANVFKHNVDIITEEINMLSTIANKEERANKIKNQKSKMQV